MTKKFLLIPLAIVLVTALIFGGCAKPTEEVPTEIRVGSVESLTGMFGAFGQGGAFGVQAAVDDINALGGVYVSEYGKKLPLRLIVVNSESDPVKVGPLAEDLVLRDKVNVFGSGKEPPPMRSPVAIIADKYKIPAINQGIYEGWEALKEGCATGFEYSWNPAFAIAAEPTPGDPRYGKAGYTVNSTWFEWLDMFGDQTNETVGCFASDEPDGRGWYETMPMILRDAGYTVIGTDQNVGLFPMETTDYTAMINEWKANDVEILWGNCPAPHFGAMWRQCHELGFQPKMVGAARAALFYADVTSWGGNLPWAVGIEMWWHPSYDPEQCPGIGDTTPQSLADKWTAETGQYLNPNTGWSYPTIQVIADAIERAGTLDGPTLNRAMGETNILTLNHLITFDPVTHFSWDPIFFGQWHKADPPLNWDLPVIFSKHDFVKATADPIFPIPYD